MGLAVLHCDYLNHEKSHSFLKLVKKILILSFIYERNYITGKIRFRSNLIPLNII